ncbi:MAG: glycosyltransferase family 2 protein [Deltaproteobacteria bacterium]|nr:glycosyltransferase family 2 protein [Deltaproteobacteria bacterium]
MKETLSCYIIAFNEKQKIGDAIGSVQWADEVVVADSFSTDGTTEIAQSLGARVVQIPFSGFGDLRNSAIAACRGDWIFSLDADERCTPEAKDEIKMIIRMPEALDAYYVPRKNFFMGRWIKYSGYYPDYRQPQLFRKGAMIFKPDPVHEGYELNTNRIGYLHNAIWQFPFKDLEQIIDKCNRYSTLGAEKLDNQGKQKGMAAALSHGMWAFIHQYVIKLGFLDGWPGFVLALSHFEATFYKYAKLYVRQSQWKSPAINLNDLSP